MRAFIAAALVAGAATLSGCSMMNHQVHANCRVTGKEILYDVSGGKHGTSTTRTKRLSTSCGAFNVSDSLAGGFQSYDMWASLEVGKVYDIETGDYRFANSFPVVTKVTAK